MWWCLAGLDGTNSHDGWLTAGIGLLSCAALDRWRNLECRADTRFSVVDGSTPASSFLLWQRIWSRKRVFFFLPWWNWDREREKRSFVFVEYISLCVCGSRWGGKTREEGHISFFPFGLSFDMGAYTLTTILNVMLVALLSPFLSVCLWASRSPVPLGSLLLA